MTQYYSMEYVTFSADNDHSFVITFLVFAKKFHRENLVLYEIETAPVPSITLHENTYSYTRIIMSNFIVL